MSIVGIKVDSVVLLVVESDACRVFADTLVVDGLDEVLPLIDNNFVFLVGIVFIFDFELIGGELLDG